MRRRGGIVSNPFRFNGDFHRAERDNTAWGTARGFRVNHHSFARRTGLVLALALCAGTAAADADALCGGSSTACLEQMSAVLNTRGTATERTAPKARRAAPPQRPRPPAAMPHLNLDQRLSSAPDDSEDQGG